MKIEEVVSIYNFLGEINIFAFLGVTVLILVGAYLGLSSLKEPLKPAILYSILVLIFTSMFMLYNEASHRNKYLKIANRIKQEFLTSMFKYKSFNQINEKFVNKLDSTDFVEIEKLFPNEFVLTQTSLGTSVYLIDPTTITEIDRRMREKAVHTREKILAYLNKDDVDFLDVNNVDGFISLQLIDNEGWLIGQEFFKLIPAGNLEAHYDKNWQIISFGLINKKIKSPAPEAEPESAEVAY